MAEFVLNGGHFEIQKWRLWRYFRSLKHCFSITSCYNLSKKV